MADNTRLNPGVGGDLIASDDIGGTKHQRVKIQYGDDGSATDVSATNPLPVDIGASTVEVGEIDGQPVAGEAAADGLGAVGYGRANASAPATTGIDAGDAVPLWTLPTGALVVTNHPTGSIEVSGEVDVGNTVTVSGEVSVDGPVELGAGSAAIGTVGVTSIGSGSNLIGKATISEGGNDAVVDSDAALRVAPKAGATIGGNGTHDAAAPSSVFPVGAVASATAPTSVDPGDSVRLWATTSGALVVNDGGVSIAVNDDGDSLSVDDGGGSLTVDGTVGVSSLPALATGSNTIGNVGLVAGTAYAARVRLTDGTNNSSVTAGGSLNVNVTNASVAVTGSVTVSGAVTISSGTVNVGSGSIAVTAVTPGIAASNLGKRHDDVAGSTDVGVAAMVVRKNAMSSLPVSEGDYTRLNVDGNGALWVTNANQIESVSDATSLVSIGSTQTVNMSGVYAETDATTWPGITDGQVRPVSATLRGVLRTSETPHPGDGCAVASYLSDGTVLAPVVKASKGTVYNIIATNTAASARYVRLYDKATAAATSDTPIARFAVPGNTSGSGFNITLPRGLRFVDGIAVRATVAAPDDNNTAIAANELMLNITFA